MGVCRLHAFGACLTGGTAARVVRLGLLALVSFLFHLALATWAAHEKAGEELSVRVRVR
jgi:hypothetical protein